MLNRQKTYLVLNYSGSPVAINTRYDSYLIPKGTMAEPSSIPLSVDEILQVNSTPAFKIGLLWFEPEYEADLYEECRIKNWQDILRDEQIEDIILNPTVEKLKVILTIENEQYFERCYGIFIGLKNSNHSIKHNVEQIMFTRRKELRAKKYTTGIKLTKTEDKPVVSEEAFNAQKAENEKMANELAELKAMMAQLMAAQNPAPAENVSEDKADEPAPVKETTTEPKKTNRGRPKKTT